MGGDHHQHGAAEGDFRTKVWSMTGGPNCRPKHWKRNTAIAMFGIFLTCIPIAMISVQLEILEPAYPNTLHDVPNWLSRAGEQRPHHPVRPIPSQLWCKNFGKKEY